MVARETGNGYQHVGMLKGFDKESWFKANCMPGRYFAYVKLFK